MSRIRVLVVEDSLTVREHLCAVLAADPEIEVVGKAENGRRAIELCHALRPDAVTLDMMLPGISGLAVTEHIMAQCPTPILVVSSSFNRGELFDTCQALAAGAVEVMEKPPAGDVDQGWERRFLSLLKLVARVKVITHVRGRLDRSRSIRDDDADDMAASMQRCELVALGASTGGPRAIVEILNALPAGFALPVLVVLHIGAPFGVAFTDWLRAQIPHPTSIAVDGQRLDAPGVVLAPPDHHLVVHDGRLHLNDEAERHSCRPSVDVLFESLARLNSPGVAACLLTGMGRDGAQGLLQIRRAGGVTIAQDEATSVVYGMPREAVLLGAAQRVLPLSEIGPALAALATPSRIRSGRQ
ncbi:MAG TPA: chemotaxis-specific protein-glutamate methyltransferase CheB [Burkholderiaceae bacterium]|nr:chemotaxis-specific protein-glutamate methyltransferase CheB [Burkholderiaceae bacterium]